MKLSFNQQSLIPEITIATRESARVSEANQGFLARANALFGDQAPAIAHNKSLSIS